MNNKAETENKKTNISNLIDSIKGHWFSTCVVGLIFPIVLSLGLYSIEMSSQKFLRKEALIVRSIERKSALMEEFTSSFSRFLSISFDIYNVDCIKIDVLPYDKDCMYDDRNIDKRCQSLKRRREISNIYQPETLLSQIRIFYNVDKVKTTYENIYKNTQLIFRSFDCSTSEEKFINTILVIEKDYFELLEYMAEEIKNEEDLLK